MTEMMKSDADNWLLWCLDGSGAVAPSSDRPPLPRPSSTDDVDVTDDDEGPEVGRCDVYRDREHERRMSERYREADTHRETDAGSVKAT